MTSRRRLTLALVLATIGSALIQVQAMNSRSDEPYNCCGSSTCEYLIRDVACPDGSIFYCQFVGSYKCCINSCNAIEGGTR
jgi:hypothetical protein